MKLRDENFRNSDPRFLPDIRVLRLSFGICFYNKVHEDRAAHTVERDGVFIVPLSQNICFFNTGQVFYGTVPRDHSPVAINREGRIRQELDDIMQLLFGFFKVRCQDGNCRTDNNENCAP